LFSPDIALFFENNLVVIFFIYGLSFFVIALTIIVSLRSLAGIGLAGIFSYLMVFSIIHGTVEWIDMYNQYSLTLFHLPVGETMKQVRFYMLALSFYFLLLFGLNLSPEKGRAAFKHTFALHSIFLILIVAITLSGVVKTNIKEAEGVLRYFLCFPSAIFAAIGFHRLSLKDYQFRLPHDYKLYLKMASYVILLYGIFAGLVVPKSNIPITSFFNQDLFFQYTGIPIQALRAFAAFLISYFMIRSMALTLAARIVGSYIVGFIVVLILGGTVFTNLKLLTKDYDHLIKLRIEEKNFFYLNRSFHHLYDFLNDPAATENKRVYSPMMERYIKDFESALTAVKAVEHEDVEEARLISRISELSLPLMRRELADIDAGTINSLKSAVNEINRIHSDEIKERTEDIFETSRNANQITVISIFIAMGGALFIGYHFSGVILRPIKTLRAGAREIAEGNLEHRLSIHTADELQELAEDFNIMGKKLLFRTRDVENTTKELKRLSITDALTGLFNRRHLYNELESEFERSKRYNRIFSVLMFDLDDFKHYNDTNGHLAGDELLRTLGSILHKNARSTDIVCRFGGEEFVVILTETDKNQAVIVAEKMRSAIEEHEFPDEKAQPLGDITVSIGVSSYPNDAVEIDDLLKKADDALYRAKGEGKNRVCAADVLYSKKLTS